MYEHGNNNEEARGVRCGGAERGQQGQAHVPEEAWEEAIDHYHGGPVVIVKVWSEVTVKKSFKVVRT